MIEKEGYESKRRELIDYAWKFTYLVMAVSIIAAVMNIFNSG
ncbi:MAG: hypothetical protein QW348_06680 [Ignisphaera sp.]